jgi:hypothetical protein
MEGKNVFCFILLGVLMMCMLTPGCTSSHATEVNQANSYMKSAESRFVFSPDANLQTISVGILRANSTAAKTDLLEAKKILQGIPTDELSAQDQQDFRILVPIIDINIQMTEIMGGPFADFIEDSQTLVQSRDQAVVYMSAMKLKQDTLKVRQGFAELKTSVDAIDEKSISPRYREDFARLKTEVYSVSGEMDSVGAALDKATGQ